MRPHYNSFAGGDVGRIEALSDGIFAFAATVLVLDFRAPDPADVHTEAQLLGALAASAHRLLPWLLSLLTLGIFWVAQQTQLSQLARSNRDLTWLFLVFLAIITVLPFSTRLLADFFAYRSAFLIYWVNIFALGLSVYVTWAYAEHAKLVREDAPPELSGAFRIAGPCRPVALRNRRARRPSRRDARTRADHPGATQLRNRAEAAVSLAAVSGGGDSLLNPRMAIRHIAPPGRPGRWATPGGSRIRPALLARITGTEPARIHTARVVRIRSSAPSGSVSGGPELEHTKTVHIHSDERLARSQKGGCQSCRRYGAPRSSGG